MLPPSYLPPFQQFKQSVEALHQAIATDTCDRATLRSAIEELQQYFQTHLVEVDLDPLEATVQQKVQAFYVEINKQLRLLSMDGMFLQAAKQSTTAEQRLQQVRDRLTLLLRYSQALCGDEPANPQER